MRRSVHAWLRTAPMYLILLLACMAMPGAAHAWFFFIPGGAIDAIADALSGSEGENCVGANAKVGDKIRVPGSKVLVVKSISGTSYRCTNPALPIRALIVEDSEEVLSPQRDIQKVSLVTSRAGLRLPARWESFAPNEEEAKRGIVLNGINKSNLARLTLYSERREGVADMLAYSNQVRARDARSLRDSKVSELVPLTVAGFPAWRYEVAGTAYNDVGYTYIHTIVDAGSEIVRVSTWTETSDFPDRKVALEQIAQGLTGFRPTASETTSSSPVTRDIAPSTSSIPAPSGPPKVAVDEPVPRRSDSPASSAQRLRELNALYKEGVITQQEFEAKKKKLLDEM